ncbi:MAG: hypothetical protein AAFQ94_25070 [Bacteroidota bacterium]
MNDLNKSDGTLISLSHYQKRSNIFKDFSSYVSKVFEFQPDDSKHTIFINEFFDHHSYYNTSDVMMNLIIGNPSKAEEYICSGKSSMRMEISYQIGIFYFINGEFYKSLSYLNLCSDVISCQYDEINKDFSLEINRRILVIKMIIFFYQRDFIQFVNCLSSFDNSIKDHYLSRVYRHYIAMEKHKHVVGMKIFEFRRESRFYSQKSASIFNDGDFYYSDINISSGPFKNLSSRKRISLFPSCYIWNHDAEMIVGNFERSFIFHLGSSYNYIDYVSDFIDKSRNLIDDLKPFAGLAISDPVNHRRTNDLNGSVLFLVDGSFYKLIDKIHLIISRYKDIYNSYSSHSSLVDFTQFILNSSVRFEIARHFLKESVSYSFNRFNLAFSAFSSFVCGVEIFIDDHRDKVAESLNMILSNVHSSEFFISIFCHTVKSSLDSMYFLRSRFYPILHDFGRAMRPIDEAFTSILKDLLHE